MLAECVLTSHPQGGPVVSWGSRRRKSSAVFADLFSHWCRWVHITFMCLVLNCDVLGGPSSSPQSCLPAVAWWVSSHNSPSNFKKSQQISAIHESTFFFHEFQSLINPFKMNLSNLFFPIQAISTKTAPTKTSPSIFHMLSPGSPGVFRCRAAGWRSTAAKWQSWWATPASWGCSRATRRKWWDEEWWAKK